MTVLLAVLAIVVQQASATPPVAIVNVNVIPMDAERVLEGQTVVVENGRITGLGRRARVPAGAQTIDGSGKYLIPGLADMHVHFHGNPPDEYPLLLPLYVANGVTTILSLRGAPQILELRSAIATGRVFGPRMYAVGTYINEPFVTTPDDVERAVVEQKRAGYDFVKLHGDLSRDAYERLLAVAARERIRVVGHAPRNLGVEVMFAERPAPPQYALVHAEEFLYDRQNRSTDSSLPHVEARIPEFARETAEARIWLMPNLTAYKAIARMVHDLNATLARPEVRYLPRSSQVMWGPATNPYTNRIRPDRYEPMMRRYALLEKLVREFHARGVRMLIGTDAMNTGVVPGFSAHDEMADLVAAGLPRYAVLRAATANAAEFLGEEGERGTVAVGQRADLVLLDANPLGDIANTRRIAGVMLRGRWLSAGEIAAMMERLHSR
jgi:hypothetical protein